MRHKTTEKKPEHRFLSFEVRAEQDEEKGAIITGHPIVYNTRTDLGSFTEMIAPGALLGADLKDVPLFVNHEINAIPLARSRNNNANSTMQLLIDDEGLFIRAAIDKDGNPQAAALWSAVSRGDINGMSFMFTVGDEEWKDLDSEKPDRIIRRFNRIFEVSACTFPAYEDTTISARSAAEALENARLALENARRRSLENDLALEKAKAIAFLSI